MRRGVFSVVMSSMILLIADFSLARSAPVRICTEVGRGNRSYTRSTISSGVRSGESSIQAVAENNCLWKPGQMLTIRFLDGHPAVIERVKRIALEWTSYANLWFKFTESGYADIRISFKYQGSWSYVGRCADANPNQPTMNFGWLEVDTDREEYQRVVLHEFGHALGLQHEHMSPLANIPWNRSKVYEYYAKEHGWKTEKTEINVLNRLDPSRARYTSFDSQSIMIYAIPETLTNNGFSIKWNKRLSENDKRFIAQLYPPSMPSGSYVNSCSPCTLQEGALRCSCRNAFGGATWSVLPKYCPSDIANCNGELRCGGCAGPRGSYQQSCRDCIANSRELTCICRQRRGGERRSSVPLPCQSDLANCDGNLRCGGC